MNTRMIWANLASSNLERTKKFYTNLGFKANTAPELVSIRIGDSNFVINFFGPERLQQPVNGGLSAAGNGQEIVFSLSADNREEVDMWVDTIKKAGGTLTAPPQDYDKGYVCCFADPDGHKFNVLYWPGM